jgi:hypothetical protein
MVLMDPGDSCVPLPPGTLAAWLGSLTCPTPAARPWELLCCPPVLRPPFRSAKGG